MALFLVLIFIVLPVAELYVIIKVGEAIGVLPTIALLILDSFLGAALLRSQGRAAWRRFNEALAAGRIPDTRGVRRGDGDPRRGVPDHARLHHRRDRHPAADPPQPGALPRAGGPDGPAPRGVQGSAAVVWGQGTGNDRPRGDGRSAPYDYDGSAREVTDPRGELPPREEDAQR